MFNKAASLFNRHFSNLDVSFRRFIKSRSDNFTFDDSLHVGDFFRTLIDQQDDQNNFRIVDRNGIGNIL